MSEGTTTVRPPAAAAPAHLRTIPALWRRGVERDPHALAYLEHRDGAWRELTWAQAALRVEELAHGLLASGIARGERIAILGRTRLEWALLDWAAVSVGAVVVPIYDSCSPREVAYVLEHSGAAALAAETAAQLAQLAPHLEALPGLRHRWRFDELDALAATGRAHAEAAPHAVAEAAAAVREDDLLTILYTSGTTGAPKGCLLTHRNYHAMCELADSISDFFNLGDVTVLFLPLAHNFGRLVHFCAPRAGYAVAFCPDPARIGTALEEVRPDFLPSVPRMYEKLHAAIRSQLDDARGLRRLAVRFALSTGRAASAVRREGRPLPPLLALRHRLADRLVYSKVKARLGGRLRIALSGGAPLAQDVAEFLHALDILVLEGYGLSECTTAATVNTPERYRFGTVGPALPGTEVRVDGDGEILIRGEHVFAGYYRDEAATADVLSADGWLRSGDVGELDADGFLRITDRKKDIIVTAGGKNVPPQNVENELKASRYVSQALVVGDRRPYIAALVTLEEDEVRKWARAHGVEGGLAELARDPRVRALVQAEVDRVNAEVARFQQVKRFAILPRDFEQAEGEITPTLKLRRRVCVQHFAAEIEALYREG